MRITYFILLIFLQAAVIGQTSRFESSGGTESATWSEVVSWYRNLDKISPKLLMKTMGSTDAGEPLRLILISNDGRFDPQQWRKQRRAVILINNGIHPGEPDGIDASMMLARDLLNGKLYLPDNVVIAIIPVYNIGGMLQRGTTGRVNQRGPREYGFRANARNYDLNRDFTKCDT